MENEQIQAAIRPMLDKEWIYKGQKLLFKRLVIFGENIKIYTEGPKQEINLKRADIETSLSRIRSADEIVLSEKTPATEEEPETHHPVIIPENLPVQTVITNNAAYLANTILNNISKLKAEPKYIQQANAINDQVKTLVEMGKVELQAIALAHQLKSNK